MNVKKVVLLVLTALGLAGCSGTPPHRIDPEGDSGLITVNELNFKDWQMASAKCVNSLLQSTALKTEDGHKPVIMISTIKNSTMQHINVNLLTQDIRVALLRSGKAITTTAVGANGAEDKATRQVRALRNDPMFNRKTVKKMGRVVAPDFSLAGEVIQQKTVQGNTEESYFTIHLTLTDLDKGLAVWEDSVRIAKQGSIPSVGF
ncbi:MAG: penicillin-binding protein activator LpoB [Kiritimatiellaeota bacterium]|nr:penicillin-binding protein activator LpoB [Kiritimatiellota bacterium]